MQEFSEILINQIGIKLKSKNEVSDLLNNEGGYYLALSLWQTINKSLNFFSDKKAMNEGILKFVRYLSSKDWQYHRYFNFQEINL